MSITREDVMQYLNAEEARLGASVSRLSGHCAQRGSSALAEQNRHMLSVKKRQLLVVREIKRYLSGSGGVRRWLRDVLKHWSDRKITIASSEIARMSDAELLGSLAEVEERAYNVPEGWAKSW